MMKERPNNFFLKKFVVGPLETNSYLIADTQTLEACVVDPGPFAHKVKDAVKKNGFVVKFIVNTHGHGDHIASNGSFSAPIFVHRLDAEFLTDPGKNLSGAFMVNIVSPKPARLLEEGDILNVGGSVLKVIHTPGHTPGSISLAAAGALFTGDTLFRGGIGRTDFDYGDGEAILDSIRNKLLSFPDDTVIYPGHGGSSTIGEEKMNNPFLA